MGSKKIARKFMSVLLTCLMVLSVTVAETKASKDSNNEWDGKADASWYNKNKTEFIINTQAQLAGVSVLAAKGYTFAGKTIRLGADLVMNEGDASEWRETAPSFSWTPIKNFAGTFDGQGYTISGLYFSSDSAAQVGFFENLTGATVKNIIIKNSFFRGRSCVGSVAGQLNGNSPSHIEGVYSNAYIFTADNPNGSDPGNNFGGIAGLADAGANGSTISKCWFDGFIFTNGKYAGGILANGENCTINISNCMNTGAITALDEVGGILGSSSGASNATVITDCFSTRSITVITTTEAFAGIYIGAVAGVFRDGGTLTIDDCYYLSGVAAYNNVNSTVTCDAAALNLVKAIGAAAKTNMSKLDFENTWTTTDDSFPRLRLFENISNDETVWDGIADTSWYNDNETEFTINTQAQLAGISVLAAGGNTFSGKTIKLGADLVMNRGDALDWKATAPFYSWTPITNFAGIFDGQGHTVSGLYSCSNTEAQIGLFANLTGAVVKNIIIKNSLFCGRNSVGSIAGELNGSSASIIEGVYSDAFVVVADNPAGPDSGYNFGGIVGTMNLGASGSMIIECWFDGVVYTTGKIAGGIFGNGNNCTVNISNCMNTGSITALDEVGGIMGCNGGASNKSVIVDCVSTGDINTTKTGEYVGSLVGLFKNGETLTINGCYYLSGRTAYNSENGTVVSNATGLASAQMIGNLAKKNMDSLEFSNKWISVKDSFPRLKRFKNVEENTSDKTVLYQRSKVWDGSVDISWYDQSLEEFTITTPEQLAGLAALTLNGLSFVNTTIKLGADIILNAGDANDWETTIPPNMWTPIRYFSGTFDGQGHKISGMYIVDVNRSGIGLFANVKSGIVKNVAIVNSYIKGKQYVGSLAGFVDRGYSIITGIYSNAIVKSTETSAGGIIGFFYSAHDSVVSQCHFSGTVYGGGKYCGGIIGNGNGNIVQIRDCAFTGSVTANDEIGGIIGRNGLPFTIDHCYSTGTIASHAGGEKLGHILGLIRSSDGSNPLVEINNCYYPSGTAIASANSDNWGIGRILDNSIALSIDEMTGTAAAANMTGLDFNTVWAVADSSTPQLKLFEDIIPSVDFIHNPNIADGFIETFNIPTCFSGTLKGVFNCGDGYYEVLVSGTTLDYYNSFLTDLEAAGYTQYTTHQIQDNYFATYTTDELTVHAYYVGCQNAVRLIVGPRGALPGLASENIYTPVTTSLLTQLDTIFGMTYIIRLVDNSFIIIDGGYHHPGECEKLYNTLKSQANGEDIVIAAWLFTHQHVDHTGVFSAFFDTYADKVTVEKLIYNFPAMNIISYLDAPMVAALDLLPKFYNELDIVKQTYPDMDIIKTHTGQKFYIRNAEIETLYTPEDYYPGVFGVVDSAGTIFSIEIEGQKIMILGDIYYPVDSILNNMYGSYLKSDYLQVAHHGYVYGTDLTTLYTLIDPAVAFFSTQANRVEEVLGYSSNIHLLNNMNVQEAYFMSEGPVTLTLPYMP